MGLTLETVSESSRMAISTMVGYEIELLRIRKILSRAQNAEMNQISVRDVDTETGQPICWENEIHTAARREDQIVVAMRLLLKDFELSPEAKTRRSKALGLRSGEDIATKQSAMNDRIRNRHKKPIADIPTEALRATQTESVRPVSIPDSVGMTTYPNGKKMINRN
jgi:hypothetical protein